MVSVMVFVPMVVAPACPAIVNAVMSLALLVTALAVTVPVGVTVPTDALFMLAAGIEAGSVTDVGVALTVVGVPVMGTVTTVPLVLTAVPALNPGGRPETAKSLGVIVPA
jgi:hypothetical protein